VRRESSASIPAYEVRWDGKEYEATCRGCFLGCQGRSMYPAAAISNIRFVGCKQGLREHSMAVAAGWCDDADGA